MDINKVQEELLNKRVRIENEYVTIFREVTNIIDASIAFKDPEIRLSAKYNLLYVVEGFIESTSEEYISDTLRSLGSNGAKVKVCIYPNTYIIPITNEEEVIKEASDAYFKDTNIRLADT